MEKFKAPHEMVRKLRPDIPVACFRPQAVKRSARWFQANFPGRVLYAVKANPSPFVIEALCKSGIRHFDVASVAEAELVARLCPRARMYFMHPVKSRKAITRAYAEFGISDFAFDSAEELQKILECTGNAADINLLLRVAVSNEKAKLALSSKFGADFDTAVALLKQARPHAARLGICFHVGSQCMDPGAYTAALDLAARLVEASGVKIDIIDAGGGFPARYPGMEPPDMALYTQAIAQGFAAIPGHKSMELWCEPGRALVAESTSVVARVELRKDGSLYLNEGTYGCLFDAGAQLGFVYPVRALRDSDAPLKPFGFYGPTCDSIDYMPGPFMLPEDIREGDYIEIGQLGAYGSAMRTAFNGFYSDETVIARDEMQASLYPEVPVRQSRAPAKAGAQ